MNDLGIYSKGQCLWMKIITLKINMVNMGGNASHD